MKLDRYNKRVKRFTPWAALCVLSLFAAMVFALPSVVSAQIIGELSQDCDAALIGSEHTITAMVTQDGVPGASVPVFFLSTGSHYGEYYGVANFDENGVATFSPSMCPASTTCPPYVVNSVDQVEITLFWVDVASNYKSVPLDVITTSWTDNEANLCSGSQQVLVGGRMILNVKKKGALKIAVCGTEDFEVSNVDLTTVELVGVAPFHSKQKDSRLCPDGKDGFVDLVLKFKNREVVEALEKDVGKELVDGDTGVTLALIGNLSDGTAFGGEWTADIKKKDKRHGKKHGKNQQYQDFGNSNNGNGKAKGHNK